MGKIRNFQEFLDLKYGGASKETEPDVLEQETQQPKISFQDFLNNKYVPKEAEQAQNTKLNILADTDYMIKSGDPRLTNQGISQLTDFIKNKPLNPIAEVNKVNPMMLMGGLAPSTPSMQKPSAEILGSALQGVTGIVSGLAETADWLGVDGGHQLANDINNWSAQYAPKDPNYFNKLVSGAASMATFLIPGVGTAGAARALSFAPKIAKAIQVGVPTVLEAFTEAGNTRNEMLNSGKSEDDANKAATYSTIANVLAIGLSNKFGLFAEGNKIKDHILTGLLEGGQEGAQDIIDNLVQGKEIDWKQVAEDFSIGSIIGVGAKASLPNIPEPSEKTSDNAYRDRVIDNIARGSLNPKNAQMRVEETRSQQVGDKINLPPDAAQTEEILKNETTGQTTSKMQEITNTEVVQPTEEGSTTTDKTKSDVSSTQVNLNEDDAKPILDYVNKIPEDKLYKEGNDFGRETEPHVTALFGIKSKNPKDVENVVKDFGNVELTLGKTSLFKNDKYDVLKVDVKSDDLQKLNQLLKDKLDYQNDFPNYTPHLTLAYLKKGEGENYVGDTSLEGKKISLNELLFSDRNYKKTSINLQPEQPNVQEKRNQERKEVLSTTPEDRIAGQTEGAQAPSVSKQPIKITTEDLAENTQIKSKYPYVAFKVDGKIYKARFGEKADVANGKIMSHADLAEKYNLFDDYANQQLNNKNANIESGFVDAKGNFVSQSITQDIKQNTPELNAINKKIQRYEDRIAVWKKQADDNYKKYGKYGGVAENTYSALMGMLESAKKQREKILSEGVKPSEQPSVEGVKQPEVTAPVVDTKKQDSLIADFFELRDQRKNQKGFRYKGNFNKLREIGKQIQQASGKAVLVDANDNLYIDKQRVRKPKEKFTPVKVEDVEITRPEAKTSFEKLPMEEVDRQTFMAEMFAEKKYLPVRLQKLLPAGFGQKKIDKGVNDIKQDAGAEQSKEAQIVREFTKSLDDELNNYGYFTLSSGQEVLREDLEGMLDGYIEERSKADTNKGDTSFEFGENVKPKEAIKKPEESQEDYKKKYDDSKKQSGKVREQINQKESEKRKLQKEIPNQLIGMFARGNGELSDEEIQAYINDAYVKNNFDMNKTVKDVRNSLIQHKKIRDEIEILKEKEDKLYNEREEISKKYKEATEKQTPVEKTKAGDLTSLKSETEVVKQKTDDLAVKYSKDTEEAKTERTSELAGLKKEKRNFDLAIENTKNEDEKQNLIKERGKLLKRIDKLEDGIGNNNLFNAEENANQQVLFQKAEPTESQAFKDWFGNSKVVDDNGKPLIVYSGHSNTPLYKNYDPKKATSGGFYASEDPDIASGYANGKFGSKEGYENGSQYRIKGKNGEYNKKLWQIDFTNEQKKKLDELAELKNEYDEYVYNLKEMEIWAEDNKRFDPLARRISYRGIYNLQNIFDYNENMGYNIAYPKQGDAPFFERQTKNDTEEIMDALGIEWQSYDWNQPGVFPIYLSIQNPLDADKPFPNDLLDALKQKAKGERTQTDQELRWNTWTKNYPLKEWIKDIEENSEGWTTQIPAKAMQILKDFGYDGIKERGQKGAAGTLPREQRRINWIAFENGQVKSAFNKGSFNYFNKDMLYQKGKPFSVLTDKQIQKEVDLINKLLPNGFKVEVVDDLTDDNGEQVRGMFLPDKKVIKINRQLADLTTIPHEIAHAGLYIVEPERAGTILKAHGWDGEGKITDFENSTLINAHEQIARKYEKYFNEKVRYNNILESLFRKLKDLFTRIYNYAKGRVPTVTEQYFKDLSKGKLNGTHNTGFGEPNFVYQKAKSFSDFMENEVGEQKKKDGLQIKDESIGETLERLFVNKNNRAKKITTGVTDDLDFYAKMELYVQKAADQYEKVLDYLTDEKDGFLKRLDNAGFSINEFGEYLWAKHATERNEAIFNKNGKEHGSGMTDIEAAKILNKPKYKNSKIEEFEKEFRKEVIRKKLSILRNGDVLTDEEVAQFDNYVNYVPLKGKAGKPNKILGTKKFSVSNTGIFEAKGRTSIPENPFIQAVLDLRDAIIRAEKNKVNQSFLKYIEKNPNKNIYEVSGRKAIPSYNKHGEIDRYNKEQLADNEIAVYIKDKEGKRKQKVITIHDPILANSMVGLGVSKNLKIMRTINDYLRTVVTIASPNFIITNFEKDLGSALINIGGEKSKTLAGKVLKDVPKAIKAFYKGKDGSGEYADWLKEYKSSGAKVGWMDNRDINELNNDFEKEIRNLNEKGYLRKAATKTIKFVENINQAIENGVRLSTYANLRKSGVSEQKAAQYAKDLTVNFERKGEYGELINTAYLFWNAGMQGSNRVYRALKSKNTRKIAGGLIALSLAQNLLNSLWDDDEYDKLSEWERDNHFIVMLGDGTHLKIKMPYGYNVFGVIGNITGDAIRGKVDFMKGAGRLGSAIVDAFNPFGSSGSWLQLVSPTVIDPVAQLAENKNFFGSPIYKEQPQFTPEVPSSQLYFKSVNPILRAITTWLNEVTGGSEKRSGIVDISPEIVEHVIEFIFGGAGKFVSQTAKTGISLFTEDETKVQSIPLVNTALGSKNEFYDLSIIYSLRNDIIRKEFSDLEKREFQNSLENAYRKNEITGKAYRTYKNQFSKYQLGIETNNSKNKYSRNYGKDYSRSYERKYD